MNNETKLVYAERYNQHYRPIFVDEENKVCHMVLAKNRKDKSVTKSMIARVEELPEWQFIIYKNEHITAEDNFLAAMRCKREFNRKLNELMNFKRNGLVDSPVAMNELLRIFNLGFKNMKSDRERRFRQRVKSLYIEICTEEVKNARKVTYDQHVPADIVNLAKEHGLKVEQNDDYTERNGRRVKATKKEKQKIRENKPCGFLVRDSSGRAIAGNGYTFSAAQTVEFIKRHMVMEEELVDIEK